MGIAVIGLGKLGLCTAVCFANYGIRVIGYDKNPAIINGLTSGECHIDEPGLTEALIKACWKCLTFSSEIEEVIDEADQTFVIVPTPSDENGRFSNKAIMNVLEKIAPFLKAKNSFHIINIVSTIMPGSCYNFIKFLETETGKTCGSDFGLTYNPEFIAIGTVIRNFTNPDMVLVGGSDPISSVLVANNYKPFCNNFSLMRLIDAEITKLSLNCFLTMKAGFANELAALCEKIPGTHIDDITNAIGKDSRIGSKFLKAGLAPSGPCLPRDGIAFREFAEHYGYTPKIIPAVIKANHDILNRIIEKIVMTIGTDYIVDIYGSSYKSGTKLTEGSQSIVLQKKLEDIGYFVRMIDGEFNYSQQKIPGAAVMMSDSMSFDFSVSAHCLFIDPWRRFIAEKNSFKKYYALGICGEND